jgi:tetratricopeptide (TPR) repeat protein
VLESAGVSRRLPTSGDQFAVRGVVSPLTGRETELGVLEGALEKALAYHAPQFVTLIGNQGTGKTRLVSEWAAKIPPRARVFAGRAASRSARYSAIARLLRHRIGIGETDDSEAARDQFRATVQAVFDERRVGEVLHFLGSFVGFRYAGSPFLGALDDNPRQVDDIARAVLRRFFEVDAATSPLVLLLDDLHLADDDTLTVLEDLGKGLAGSAVVLVALARPELLVRRPDWGATDGDATRLEVRNLEPAHAAAVLRHLLARCDHVPAYLVEDAVAMTGGNPYFLEELVRVFLESGAIDTRASPWRIDAAKAAATELPISIEQAIEARIAALDPDERELLEKAAIFGGVFWLSAVVALTRMERLLAGAAASPIPPVAPTPPSGAAGAAGWMDDRIKTSIAERVERLVERDYLLSLPPEDSSIPGDVEIVFKHNLERELVLKMTDPERRRRYHRIAAQWLEIKLGERSEEQLDFLAQLYERGAESRRAAAAYLGAGDKARARYANQQAVEFYRKALSLLEYDDVMARMDALHNMGSVLVLVGRTEEALAQFQEMLRVAWLFDHAAKAGAAHGRIGRIYRQRGEYELALEHFRAAGQLFERAGDRRGAAGVLDDVGSVHWLLGVYAAALGHHRQALEIRRQLGDKRSIALSLANIGRVHHDSGAFQPALERFREALDLRREAGDLAGMVSSMCDLGAVHEADGKLDAAHDMLADALKLAREIGDRLGQAHVLGRMGEVLLAMGRTSEAQAALAQADEIVTALGDRMGQAEVARRLAEAALVVGDRLRALEQANRGLDLAQKLGSRVHVGTAQRVLAEVLASGADAVDGADAMFRGALQVLTQVRNDLELARTYRAFAAFRERLGHAAEAVQLRMRADEIFGRLRGAASAAARRG